MKSEKNPLLRMGATLKGLFKAFMTPFRRIWVLVLRWNNPVNVVNSHNVALVTQIYDTLISTLKDSMQNMPKGRDCDELGELLDVIEECKKAYISTQK